jgi:hypothetical protein
LQAVFAASSRPGLRELSDLSLVADSTLRTSLAFDPTKFPASFRNPSAIDSTDDVPGVALLRSKRPLMLGPEVAAELASQKLGQVALPRASYDVDSVWTRPTPRGTVATVRFASAEPSLPETFTTDVSVSPTGSLQDVEVQFVQAVRPSRATTVMRIISMAVYAILGLILVVTFFRRMISGTIDVKAALVDSLTFGAVMALYLMMVDGLVFGSTQLPWWGRLVAVGGVLMIGGGGAAVLSFLMTSAADALAREAWPRKMFTTSLVRQGALANHYVGRSLLRGIALGCILTGATVLVSAVLPGAPIVLSEDSLSSVANQPFLWVASTSALFAYVQTLLLIIGVSALVFRRGVPSLVIVGTFMVVFGLAHAGLITFDDVGGNLLVSAVTGVVLAFTFVRFDVFTCFVALFVGHLIWGIQEGWLMDGSGLWADVLVAGLSVGGVGILGFVGIRRGGPSAVVADYVPPYIVELKRHERMQSELEIARQVQASFLPREMPRVNGIDLAATCLAAQEVGGDYYDVVRLGPTRLALAVGDVSGKGIEAAFYMTLTKGFVRSLCRQDLPPSDVLCRINALFCESAPKGIFVSMIYGVVDLDASTFCFARAGHNPVIVKRRDTPASQLRPSGLAIGLTEGAEFDRELESVEVGLDEGDLLVFYTDGFSEARNTSRQEYGDDRLTDLVSLTADASADEIVSRVTADVSAFASRAARHDDMTILVAKIGHGAGVFDEKSVAENVSVSTPVGS